MLMEQERKQIVKYSRLLLTRNLTRGTGGNISIYDRNTMSWDGRMFLYAPFPVK